MLSAKLRNWVILLGWGVLVSALVSCDGGGTSTTPPQSVRPPVIPSVTSTVPGAVNAGQPFLNLEVDGSNFLPGATVLWNGSARPTTLENSATLSVSLAAGDIASAGTAQISVLNPPPKGGTSNVFVFTITAPVNATPSLSSVTPSPIFCRKLVHYDYGHWVQHSWVLCCSMERKQSSNDIPEHHAIASAHS